MGRFAWQDERTDWKSAEATGLSSVGLLLIGLGIFLTIAYASGCACVHEWFAITTGLCVIGLAFYAKGRGGDVAWCTMALAPILGPILGVLIVRLALESKSPDGQNIRATEPRPGFLAWKRILKVIAVLGVVPALVYGTVLVNDYKSARMQDAGRITLARWQSQEAFEQALRYQQAHSQNPGSIKRLLTDFPTSELDEVDPWGRPWVVSAAFTDTRIPPNPKDLWICSRGPTGTGPCPPTNIPTYAGPLDGSVGYSGQFGGWQGSEGTRLSRVPMSLPWLLPFAYIIAYLVYRLGCVVLSRPRNAPTLEALYVVCLIALVAALVVPGPHAHRRARYSRAAGDAKTAMTQAMVYARDNGVYPTSIKALREGEIVYCYCRDKDPWGNDWVLAPVLTEGRKPQEGDNVYVYSRGPIGAGRYPRPFTSDTGPDGAVGSSSVHGGFDWQWWERRQSEDSHALLKSTK